MQIIIIIIAIFIIGLPVILRLMLDSEFFSSALGSTDGWLSYWGGYLGAMIGLAAISVTTHLQIKSQNKLLETQMKDQERSMLKQFELQKELQEKSIDESTKANDKTERDRIYMNLLIRKNEELIENLIELHYFTTKMYNILRDYVEYKNRKNELNKKISEKFEKEFLSISKSGKVINKEMFLKKQELVNKIIEVKESETECRIKITDISAKVKTRSMYFKELQHKIENYKTIIISTTDEFYEHILKEDINLKDLSGKIEESSEEVLNHTNSILNSCQDNLLKIVNDFVDNKN